MAALSGVAVAASAHHRGQQCSYSARFAWFACFYCHCGIYSGLSAGAGSDREVVHIETASERSRFLLVVGIARERSLLSLFRLLERAETRAAAA